MNINVWAGKPRGAGTPPSVAAFANIGGKFEGQGPLKDYFDELCDDAFFGEKTWEKAESTMQKRVLKRALERAGVQPEDVDYILAGDLLNQCIGSSFQCAGVWYSVRRPSTAPAHPWENPSLWQLCSLTADLPIP